MFYVKVENGVVVTQPKRVSTSPSDSPNTDWKAEQLAIHGFVLIDIENQKVVDGKIVTITAEEKESKRQEEEAKNAQAKNERRNAKRAVLAKLKIDVSDLPGLRALIADGNDD